MAAFQVIINGRYWVITEVLGQLGRAGIVFALRGALRSARFCLAVTTGELSIGLSIGFKKSTRLRGIEKRTLVSP
jgi:hypothetical protein